MNKINTRVMANYLEKLEIMQWLFESGYKPSLLMHGIPWYPLEQVLELLPHHHKDNTWSRWILSRKNICYKITVGAHGESTEEVDSISIYSNFSFDKPVEDYHLAALQLLKRMKDETK